MNTDPDDPMSLDPTVTFPRGDRRHDDKGRPRRSRKPAALIK